MSTAATTAQTKTAGRYEFTAGTFGNVFPRLFTSPDYAYAQQQARNGGFSILRQTLSLANIAHETAVTVAAFHPIVNPRNDWKTGRPVLGHLELRQTRTMRVDKRTDLEKLTNTGRENIEEYKKEIVCFWPVVADAKNAEGKDSSSVEETMKPGTSLPNGFYLAEAISFVPAHGGHNGIVIPTNNYTKRYREGFLLSKQDNGGKREADVLILSQDMYDVKKASGNEGLFDMVLTYQLDNGLLTEAERDEAEAKYTNNQPTEDAAK